MIHQTLARSIRLVGLDVDGVLTDGGIYLGASDGPNMIPLANLDELILRAVDIWQRARARGTT